MRTYFKTTFWTIFGLRDFVTLRDFAYAEWLIYNGNVLAYHVACFRENSASDAMVNQLITEKRETMDSILRKINERQGTKLHFGRHQPLFILIQKKEEFVELDLPPLPENWIKAILI